MHTETMEHNTLHYYLCSHDFIYVYLRWGLSAVGAFLQATSRVPRWWIGERPPDMAASCDIYK